MEENREQKPDNNTSTSLNILCAICSEFFKSTDIIESTTKCGHVFHRQCLYRWVSRSNTCPQCRAPVHKYNVHRLYLNFCEPTSLDDIEVEPIKGFEWLYVDETITEKELADIGFVLGDDKEDISNDDAEYKWVSASEGEVPENALETGYCETGEILYTARAVYNDRVRYGKLHPSHGCTYMPYKAYSLKYDTYECYVALNFIQICKKS
ncbi:hypothetical protein DOY81_013751 [Sarcophaga bullata]|nr:hypothetical protein DOY81_013751 [Sarcophaga bullata]